MSWKEEKIYQITNSRIVEPGTGMCFNGIMSRSRQKKPGGVEGLGTKGPIDAAIFFVLDIKGQAAATTLVTKWRRARMKYFPRRADFGSGTSF